MCPSRNLNYTFFPRYWIPTLYPISYVRCAYGRAVVYVRAVLCLIFIPYVISIVLRSQYYFLDLPVCFSIYLLLAVLPCNILWIEGRWERMQVRCITIPASIHTMLQGKTARSLASVSAQLLRTPQTGWRGKLPQTSTLEGKKHNSTHCSCFWYPVGKFALLAI